jgi:hypothetical protein
MIRMGCGMRLCVMINRKALLYGELLYEELLYEKSNKRSI